MTSRTSAALAVLAGLGPSERVELLVSAIERGDALELAAVPVAWFRALGELAKQDPIEAGRLTAAMYSHLAAYRPESPAPLDSGFVPTEPARKEQS